MDPNLFHLDWERTFEALVGIIVLSFLVERACAVLIESRWWISRFDDARIGKPLPSERKPSKASKLTEEEDNEAPAPKPQKPLAGQRYPLKEFLGFAVALAICWVWEFDAVSIIMLSERTQLVGIIVTAAVGIRGTRRVKIRASAQRRADRPAAFDAFFLPANQGGPAGTGGEGRKTTIVASGLGFFVGHQKCCEQENKCRLCLKTLP
jgi:hypothetical protein